MNEKDFAMLQAQMADLSPEQFKSLVQTYAKANGGDTRREWDKSIFVVSEQHLVDLGINRACPACGSIAVVHNGLTDAGIQRFRCQDCGRSFTRFTGTLLEKSRFPWEVWVEVLRMTLNDDSLETMQTLLSQDFAYACEGINVKTLFAMRLKLVFAMATIEPPKLTGVVQMDETVVRESQKGSRELVSYLKGYERKPRYGRKPSKFGSLSPEFATILTAVDSRGFCVCEVVSLGRASPDTVIDLYERHCVDAAYLCSDANVIYSQACDLLNIAHYIRPSDYTTIVKHGGFLYADEAPDMDPDELHTHNRKVLERLYREGQIDRIEYREDLNYKEFRAVKDAYRLSLARVNELHSDLKLMVERKMTNVSTKYLNEYVRFFTFRRNWRTEHGHYPSNRTDAESILKHLLTLQVNLTRPELEEVELTLPKVSGRAVQLLKEKTAKAREITKNKYFKFNSEDIPCFNVREILLDAPRSHLNEIAKAHKIKGYRDMNTWVLVTLLTKLDDIDAIIIDLVTKNRSYMIDDEDIKYLASLRYMRRD